VAKVLFLVNPNTINPRAISIKKAEMGLSKKVRKLPSERIIDCPNVISS